jgi:hypothetical protein
MTSAPTAASTRREPELLGQTVVVFGGSAGIGLVSGMLDPSRRRTRSRQAGSYGTAIVEGPAWNCGHK